VFIAVSAALQAAALILGSGCDSPAAISGTVVDPSGAPIHRAVVQLWYEGDPHRGVGVTHETRTDERGGFAIEDVGDPFGYSVIVEHEGVRRRFLFRPTPGGPGLLRIRIGPTTPQLVRLTCPEPASRGVPQIRFRWSPGDDLWYLGPMPGVEEGQPAPMADLITPFSVTAPATEYALQVPVPEGESRVEVTGPCGEFTRVVRVSPEGPGLEPLLLGRAPR